MIETRPHQSETGLPVASLLVAIDGSPFSERVIVPACRLAGRLRAPVKLWSAASTPVEAAAYRAVIQALAEPNGSAWEIVVNPGELAELLAEGSPGNPLVCLATHGRNRSAALMYSATSAVLTHSTGPVLLVGPVALDRPAAHRLVVCIGGGPESEGLVSVGAAWAAALDLDITVLTVAEPVPESLRYPGTYPRLHGPHGDADAYLEAVTAPWHAGGTMSGKVLWDPVDVHGALLDELAADPPELTVMGTHAPRGLRRLILGSTAAAVAHGSPAPVLVVPV